MNPYGLKYPVWARTNAPSRCSVFSTLFILCIGTLLLNVVLGGRLTVVFVSVFATTKAGESIDIKALQCSNPFIHQPNLSGFPSYTKKANATFVMLARNRELAGVIESMKRVEGRFNRDRHYPWVFLNDEPFSDEFKNCTSAVTSSPTYYGLIARDHWQQPESIDEPRAAQSRLKMEKTKVPYAGSISYRNMCRFYSGFFYRHELLQNYRYYWRVEPDINYRCEIDYDPFLFMEENNKTYGFTIAIKEQVPTVPSLWSTTQEFIRKNRQYVSENNALRFLSEDEGETWNYCHFWSNFEVADLDFYRSEAYQKYFEHLEAAGGFYYERWGDAPVHSIAASLFLDRNQVHFFEDIAYEHDFIEHCPLGLAYERGRCTCNPRRSIDYTGNSCVRDWEAVFQQRA